MSENNINSVKVRGVKIPMNGVDYVVPPMNLKTMQMMQDQLAAYDSTTGMQQLAVAVDIIQAAMRRNYPEITKDELMEMVDLGNMVEVMDAVMGATGMVKAKAAEILNR